MTTTTELYDRWVAALKTGNYPKTRGTLHDDCGFCCLGVATDLVLVDENEYWQYANYELNPNVYSYRNGTTILPDSVAELLNFGYNLSGVFELNELSSGLQAAILALFPQEDVNGRFSLTTINDSTNDFDLIIEILEERPPSLFEKE